MINPMQILINPGLRLAIDYKHSHSNVIHHASQQKSSKNIPAHCELWEARTLRLYGFRWRRDKTFCFWPIPIDLRQGLLRQIGNT